MKHVHLITGCTYPFQAEIWRSRRLALKRAAEMRRVIRQQYGQIAPHDCGIIIQAVNPANYSPAEVLPCNAAT